MRYSYYYRSARSASPEISYHHGAKTMAEHVDNLITQSRAHSEIREAKFQDEFLSAPAPSQLRHPDLHYATLLCNSLSPWSKTGAFYYPSLDYVEEKLNEFSASIRAEIDYNLELDYDQRKEGEDIVGIGLEKIYLYPEGWRGTASCTPPMRREFTYWTNPARYYRYQTYYPRYRSAPRYRARFYR